MQSLLSSTGGESLYRFNSFPKHPPLKKYASQWEPTLNITTLSGLTSWDPVKLK